jgi:hypothetical protein
MRDLKADWKRWTGGERMTALAVLATAALSASSLVLRLVNA